LHKDCCPSPAHSAEVYPSERVEDRYRRYFQAFFQVDGDMVRQRLPARPIVEPIDPSPGEPGGISAAVVVEFCKLISIPVPRDP
jgi:hypothetical protein